MKYYTTLLFVLATLFANQATGQANIKGQLNSEEGPVIYANVVLYTAQDSSMYKVESTDDQGQFTFTAVNAGSYFLVGSYIGLDDYRKESIAVSDTEVDLGQLNMMVNGVELETAVVTAQRALVEVKPDRTVFNVQGTVNSTGDNGLNLLRKAPGVLLDNNNNVSVLGRSGVLFYVDGKRLPLSGDELSGYLSNIPAEQIDRIDIITNPGARYEAEGNAGIIDIRLKKDKSLGTNGSLSGTYSAGRKHRSNLSATANHRTKAMNIFGTLGYFDNESNQLMTFDNYQNEFRLLNKSTNSQISDGYNFRLGTDFFISKNHTIGFLVNRNDRSGNNLSSNTTVISSNTDVSNYDTTPADVEIPTADIDSVQMAENIGKSSNVANTYNINYVFNDGKKLLSLDADYGNYRNTNTQDQPNNYFDSSDNFLRSSEFSFNTPVDINITTFKVDYETDGLGGKLGVGGKYGNVSTDNVFLFYNGIGVDSIFNTSLSNTFAYAEKVTAGYLSYARALNQKWNLNTGLRVEHTNSVGTLTTFEESLQKPPTEQDYISYFPSLGLTYAIKMGNTMSFNYGRRINRPDYNVLNPFRTQMNELGFAIGNPTLKPEIVNNVELGYTHKFRYNFKIGYSITQDKITRLIGTDDSDPKASFINWDNLAEQRVFSINAALPFQFGPRWSAFFNISANHQYNQANYPNGDVIDVGAWGYNLYQQHTLTLGKGFIGEISGWYAGPGIWGGVFVYEDSFSLNLGLQKKFLSDQLKARVAVDDVFNQAFWSGFSEFGELVSYGEGNWDSRRVSASLTYTFGNKEVKSRKRKTGLEDESKRVGSSSSR